MKTIKISIFTLFIGIASFAMQPTAISICSGTGATDRIMLNNGIRVIASVDFDAERTFLSQINNNPVNQLETFDVITGDVTAKVTQDLVVQAAERRLYQNKEVDLVYAFIAKGKEINHVQIVDSTFKISLGLAQIPKLIILELLNSEKALQDLLPNEDIQACYRLFESKVKFSDFGLPISNKRIFRIYVRNDILRPGNTLLPDTAATGSIEQAFISLSEKFPEIPRDWWKEQDPQGKLIPLHSSSQVKKDAVQAILGAIPVNGFFVHLKCPFNFTGEPDPTCGCPFCAMIRDLDPFNGGNQVSYTTRCDKDGPFKSITGRSCLWFYSIHPVANRTYTPYEMAVLQGMHWLGNFNISTKAQVSVSEATTLIAAVTSPEFLNKFFARVAIFLGGNRQAIALDTSKLSKYLFDGELILSNFGPIKSAKNNKVYYRPPFSEADDIRAKQDAYKNLRRKEPSTGLANGVPERIGIFRNEPSIFQPPVPHGLDFSRQTRAEQPLFFTSMPTKRKAPIVDQPQDPKRRRLNELLFTNGSYNNALKSLKIAKPQHLKFENLHRDYLAPIIREISPELMSEVEVINFNFDELTTKSINNLLQIIALCPSLTTISLGGSGFIIGSKFDPQSSFFVELKNQLGSMNLMIANIVVQQNGLNLYLASTPAASNISEDSSEIFGTIELEPAPVDLNPNIFLDTIIRTTTPIDGNFSVL